MLISPVNLNISKNYGSTPAFCAKNKEKKERHPLLAMASAMAPGTGQFLDGRIVSGAKYITIAVLSSGLAAFLFLSSLGAKNNKLKLAGGFTALAVSAYNHIANIWDAYRGGK